MKKRRCDKTCKAYAKHLFYKKYNKGYENDTISNRCNGFAEDIELGNAEFKEELVKLFAETDWKKQKAIEKYEKRNW